MSRADGTGTRTEQAERAEGSAGPVVAAGTGWAEWADRRNAKARARGRWRELRDLDALGLHGRLADGREVTVFAANDYLGLSAHTAVVEAAEKALKRWGAGAGAARLLSGSRPVHRELEERLAAWKGTESALLFPSGYSTNIGVLSALAAPQVQICSDSLNHASIIDGCRLASASGAKVEVYPHSDVQRVEALLEAWRGRSVVVTDSVFSMDGDAAPVAELAASCARHGALLVLDEAHAVLGPQFGRLPCELLRVGTLSKTLGSQGGFVAGTRPMVELLVNWCRPFIFTTALAPSSAAAALAALGIVTSSEGTALLAQLESNVRRLRAELEPPTLGAPGGASVSPIIPFVIGSENEALEASNALLQSGLFVPAVRPPTVPPGTSRLRVALSAAHTDDEVDQLCQALGELGLMTT